MPRNSLAGKGKNKRPGSNLSTGRSYARDKIYQSTPAMKKYRAELLTKRRQLISKGILKKVGDPRDIAHRKDRKGGGTLKGSGYTLQHRSKNRAKK